MPDMTGGHIGTELSVYRRRVCIAVVRFSVCVPTRAQRFPWIGTKIAEEHMRMDYA